MLAFLVAAVLLCVIGPLLVAAVLRVSVHRFGVDVWTALVWFGLAEAQSGEPELAPRVRLELVGT